MDIFILTIGTRGDIETFLILGRELRRRGHRVLVGTSSFYSGRVLFSQLEWVNIGSGTQEQLQAVMRSLSDVDEFKQRSQVFFRNWMRPQFDESRYTIESRAAAADYFISNVKMCIRQNKRVVPGAFITYDLPASLNDLASHGSQQLNGRIIELVAMNKCLVDWHNVWDSVYQFTGFWLDPQPAEWQPSDALLRFLSRGTPPVVITMGSMASFDVLRLAGIIEKALHLAGQRGIILGNWPEMARAFAQREDIQFEADIPYGWLFRHACCVIHHGGVGTVAATLSAGLSCIVLPQIPAQQRLARVLFSEGLATGVFHAEELDSQKLSMAIQTAIADPKYPTRARAWQAVIARDRGVLHAADLIEEHWKGLQSVMLTIV